VQVFATLQRDRNTYHQMMDLRMFLEGECIARLAREGKAVAKKRLREKLALMDRNRDNLGSFSKADLAFHLTLVDESGLKLHATIMRGLLRGVGFKYARETYVDRSVVARVLEEHSAICDALESGGVRESKKASAAHLQSSLHRMETLIRGG
jgi:DNA-binding FadR family transcriptional regulator